MSTIASPRQSTTSLSTPTSSRRPSLDTLTRSQATSPARPARRNKAALRDYYGLKSAATVDASKSQQSKDEAEEVAGFKNSELDAPDFDAAAYVRDVLAKESLHGILKVEGSLINEIRGLDGEKKALVYDNYSKLITATDTIRKMRTNMDPLTPTTSTLSPTIAHIAETATSLAASLRKKLSDGSEVRAGEDDVASVRKRQRETVRWVLAAPKRLKGLLDANQTSEANHDWEEIQVLLGKWKGVDGVEDIRGQCEKIMHEDVNGSPTIVV